MKIHKKDSNIILESRSTSWDDLILSLDEFPDDFLRSGREQSEMQEREELDRIKSFKLEN